jgi:proline dehydrogenase
MRRFIAGTDVESLKQALPKLFASRYTPIVDYAKEGSKSISQVNEYTRKIDDLIKHLDTAFHRHEIAYALKLSSFLPSYPYMHMNKLIKNIHASNHPTKFVFLDAEHTNQLSKENHVFNKILEDSQDMMASSFMIYKTYQMYRRDAMSDLMKDLDRFDNIGVKIVRGAYHDSNDVSLFNNKADVDANYNDVIELLTMTNKKVHVCFATHNRYSVEYALDQCERLPDKSRISFAQLLGMGDDLSQCIKNNNFKVFKYTPYGSLKETYPYLFRRLIENHSILQHAF